MTSASYKNLPCRGCGSLISRAALLLSIALICLTASIVLESSVSEAAISELNAWPAVPQLNSVTSAPAATAFTPSAGSNRIILISVHDHTNNTTATTISVTYGSNNVPARAIVSSPNNQRRQVWLFYLNESDIASATGNTITVSNNNVGSGMSVYIATLSGVDQSSTVVPTPYAIYNPAVNYSFNVGAGGYAMFSSTDNDASDPTNNEGYAGNSSAQVGTAYSYVAARLFPTASTTSPTYTTSATYSAFAAAAFNPAFGDTTPPTVLSTTPADGASGVALNGSVSVTWSEDIDCTTVDASTITISGGGWALSACSANSATFNTTAQNNSTTYTVTVGTGVRDLAGNNMVANQVFSYTTVSGGGPAVPAGNLPVLFSVATLMGLYGARMAYKSRRRGRSD